jgi:uroporphyrinogen decarboxylase
MNSRERILGALSHREPDRVPFDLGGTGLTTIHVDGYRRLRSHLGLPPVEVKILAQAEQLAVVDEDVAEQLGTDLRLVLPGLATGFEYRLRDEGEYIAYTDEWGIGWRKPKQGGFYFDMYEHPLAGAESLSDLQAHYFPDPLDPGRFATLRSQAEAAHARGKAIVLAGPCAGILEVYSWMRGYEPFYIDLAANQDLVGYMLDWMVEFKCAFWERALGEIGDLVDVVVEADDMAGQQSMLLSPKTYRKLIEPRHQRLFSFIKAQAPVKLFFHSCGAVRPVIPDLIDAGIDILNPVQISAAGMDPHELKREFGRDLVFWGGGQAQYRSPGSRRWICLCRGA